MASLEKLRADYQAATEANRKAYDAFNGVWGDEQIKRNYEIAVRDKDKETIARLKPKYEALAAAYKATQEEKNRLKKELTKAEKEATTKKETEAKAKGAAGVYRKALDDLAIAESGLGGYQGEENYNKAYLAAEAAFKDITDAGKTPKAPLPLPKITITRPEVKTVDGQTGDQGTGEQQVENLASIINGLSADENQIKKAQMDAAKFGYKGGVTGKWSLELQKAIENAYQTRITLPKNLQGTSFAEFLVSPQIDLSGISGTGGYKPRTTITNDVQAAAYVDAAIQSELKRSASNAEIKALTGALRNYEKANPTRYQDGTTSGGASPQNYLIQLIRGQQEVVGKSGLKTVEKLVNEFKTSAGAKVESGLQTLKATANANGLDLDINFASQLPAWKEAIKAGKPVSEFQAIIRNAARTHLPDSIKGTLDPNLDLNNLYAPYINSYAKTFGVDPVTVKISDIEPLALTEKGTLAPIYEFDRKKRKLLGWDKTPEGISTVSDAIKTVLQDFGFMG